VTDVVDGPAGAGGRDRTPRRRRGTRAGIAGLLAVGAALTAVAAGTSVARADGLPDGRVYERVSPADTNGNGANNAGGPIGAVVDDDDILWGEGVNPLGPDQTSGYDPLYLLHRTASGWSSQSMIPSNIDPYEEFRAVDATDDLSAMVFDGKTSQDLSGVPPDDQAVPYSLVYRNAAGGFQTIASDSLNQSDPSFADPSQYGGMTADGGTVIYSSDASPASLPAASGTREVYAWNPTGVVTRLGSAALQTCGLEVAGLSDFTVFNAGSQTVHDTNAVSDDGSTVFLTSGDEESPLPSGCPSASQLYVDTAGTVSQISVPTDGTAVPHTLARAFFEGASPDGTTAYFITTMKLSADDPDTTSSDLYQWTAPQGGQPASVACLSCTLPNHSANFVGAADVSRDGQYVYFAANGPGGTTPLYVAHAGTVERVAADTSNQNGDPVAGLNADGDVVVLYADAPHSQTALYRATVSGATVSPLACVSCRVGGGAAGDGALGLINNDPFSQSTSPRGGSTLAGTAATGISADGNVIAFTSDDALNTDDTITEIYEWTPASGAEAIGPGGGPGNGDASITPDGSGIFFFSPQALTPDTTQPDTLTLYDARIGGGFPAAAPGGCSGDACQGGASAPPSAPGVASTIPTSGNVPASAGGRSAHLRLRPPTRAALVAAVRHGQVSLNIGVHGVGTVTARATARIGGRTRTIARRQLHIHVTGSRARTRRLTLALDPAARRALARTGRLRVTVRLTMRHASARTITFTLTKRGGR
jgi:hypothetical protein